MRGDIKKLVEENIALHNKVNQLKILYLSVKSENKELEKRLEDVSKRLLDSKPIGAINSKISDEMIQKVIDLRKRGLSYRDISEQTKISKSSVGNIIKEYKV